LNRKSAPRISKLKLRSSAAQQQFAISTSSTPAASTAAQPPPLPRCDLRQIPDEILARTSMFMFYPWVQMLKLEDVTPFGPRLARHHAQSMRANDLVLAPSVLFVVESARAERGWTRFELRDPTGMVVAGTRDDGVQAKLVVGAAVKLTNVSSSLITRAHTRTSTRASPHTRTRTHTPLHAHAQLNERLRCR
jgi:hypothetical protein